MTSLREAAQQALEALKYLRETAICSADTDTANEVIPALEDALAQQAEPDHETRAELAEQQVVQLAKERDHYRNLWQKAQQAEPVEPVAVTVAAVAEVIERDGEPELCWLIEGGICALPVGYVLVIAHRPITGDDGSGEVYIAPPQQAEPEPQTCTWQQDGDSDSGVYGTSCGRYFNIEDGTPEDNRMAWCCYCGKKLAQELITENEDE